MSAYNAPAYGLQWRDTGTIDTIRSSSGILSSGNFISANAVPAADMAVYTPVRVPRRFLVRRLFVAVGVAAGNIDVGIYDSTGTRIVSSGLTTAAQDLTIDVTDAIIGPGLYYLAFLGSTVTTLAVMSFDIGAPYPAALGVLTEQLGSGGALPASATWAMNQTLTVMYVVAAIGGQVIA